ncbi:MAG TPA: M14 family metallocarboxypeptidase [Casimicrobiaceae bacterium]|nr:M14 family metallocarboxypeptidase [Casimicrobiaceae bacterium]
MTHWPTRFARVAGASWIAMALAPTAHAVYDPTREYVELPAVAARYPDPAVEIATPAFATGKTDFTSQGELEAFVDDLSRRSRDLRVRIAGYSQEHRVISLLVFAHPAAASGGDVQKNGKPTVLIIGQQHGNEPAGSEAALALAAELSASPRARILDRVNVVIVPRANPDGAYHFVRGLKNGADVNRDHLLEGTPEGRALGHVFVEYQPDVVLDCHEFGVKTRWFEKFGGLQRHDALIQYATVSNLSPALTELAETVFRQPLIKELSARGLSQSWYYASSYDMNDKVVSMGGVVPDTGRNIAGLRNAVSFLIETRGVGIGRAHFKRRVQTHLIAMNSMLDSAAANGPAVMALVRQVRADVAAAAGVGELVIAGSATLTRHTLELVDPETGAYKSVEVDWRSALEMQVRQKRSRPYGYLLPASEVEAATRLVHLGATVLRVQQDAHVVGERYRIMRMQESKKEDVRRNDDDGAANVVQIATVVEPAPLAVKIGDFYVPMDQPLANVIAAALEPETQSSYAANRVLVLPKVDAAQAAFLPLYRLPNALMAPAVVYESN